ncbi:hem peroxidase [Dillenia turbinata]|uniref:Peroxidase n=1 Tax=Dillenia turbinata TaxID=194707 RepID=A0AAN8UPS9_9MAGN
MVSNRSFLIILVALCVLGSVGISNAGGGGGGLRMNFYSKSCRQAEGIVKQIVQSKVQSNPAVAAKLVRLLFHDCFVRGCDASILLDTVGSNKAEKDAGPNLSLAGFDVIDEIKTAVEQACPGNVSCADILVLSARDAVATLNPKAFYNVPTGRRDGVVSLISDVNGNIPGPNSNFTTLKNLFASKGLNVNDLVALSGAHTIGVAHCGAFSRRLYNFTGKGDADPSLDATYAQTLRAECPLPTNPSTTVEMDPGSSTKFDTSYFTILNQHKGLFQSDAALLTDTVAARVVNQLQNPSAFSSGFGRSMQTMSAIGVLVGNAGEIRKQCHFVN